MQPDWGYLPDHALKLIKRREWDNLAALKARLLGKKKFPIRLGLKPPNARKAVLDMDHYLNFVESWKNFPYQDMVQWEIKNWRKLDGQRLPTFLTIPSIRHLVQLMGKQGARRYALWEKNMRPILDAGTPGSLHNNLYHVLVRHLEVVERLSKQDSALLSILLPQLKPGLGKGCYLRALPVTGVDTKFIETHKLLIEELLDAEYGGALSAAGGLLNWLECKAKPKGWLVVRPLCEQTQKSLGGLPILKVPGDVLTEYELSAKYILVVENIQSGLALPYMKDTIAVIGGGKNVAWMDARWLDGKHVGYWGDIDTWGFSFLSDARSKVTGLTALMMDRATLLAHEERMDVEPKLVTTLPQFLNKEERSLFKDLNTGKFKSNRLEQERISSDYIHQELKFWLSSV
nr:DUF3322 domain-containing protein [uncultured Desulfobacter sp.]